MASLIWPRKIPFGNKYVVVDNFEVEKQLKSIVFQCRVAKDERMIEWANRRAQRGQDPLAKALQSALLHGIIPRIF